MNKEILYIKNQDFINKNIDTDVVSLLLKGITFEGVQSKEIIEQIESKKKSQNKLPTWFKTKNIYYPNKLNIEQTSSEIAAKYKSNLISGNTIIDLTGGFGVDSYYFSLKFKEVTHCEINPKLSKIAAHNFLQLSVFNVDTVCINGLDYLKKENKQYDYIYIDPSRRDESKQKVFFLGDCLPNLPKHIELLFQHTQQILIKTSPLLDLSIGIKELKYVKAIYVIAINNDVKELLWILEKSEVSDILIETVNISKTKTSNFKFHLKEESKINIEHSDPLKYLYEPNAAIMKSGAYKTIAQRYNIKKLHQHSHLYTSDNLIDFPGRTFKIDKVISYKKGKTLGLTKANITVRNFPETVNQIRKKLKIKDGGDTYIFATTSINLDKTLVVCSKAK